jgi:hypothetical protein
MRHTCRWCQKDNGYEEGWHGYVCWNCQGTSWVVPDPYNPTLYPSSKVIQDGVRLEKTEVEELRERVRQLEGK